MKKTSLMFDRFGREIEVVREGEQIDSVRFKELSRTERFTGRTNKAIKNFGRSGR